MNFPRHSSHRAYTLVELIVALAVFSIVMVIATGAYLIVINANRQAQGLVAGIDNLSFAIESMTRDIRTGTKYQCGGVDGVGGGDGSASTITFQDQSGTQVTYKLTSSSIQKKTGKTAGIPYINLTDPVVQITTISFYCTGTMRGGTNADQAFVRINIAGTITTIPGKTVTFNIDDGAAMRGTDI